MKPNLPRDLAWQAPNKRVQAGTVREFRSGGGKQILLGYVPCTKQVI
jgi:hypothetical protein